MSAKAKFTAADVKRAVSGVTAAGLTVGRVRINPKGGEIEILLTNGKPVHDNDEWADLA